MHKIKYFLIAIVFTLGCKSSVQPIQNQYNVVLKDGLKTVIEQYLKLEVNSYLNHEEYNFKLDKLKNQNSIRLLPQINNPDDISDGYFGIASYNNYNVFLYGEVIDGLYEIDKSVTLVKEKARNRITLDYSPLVWTIKFNEDYEIIKVSGYGTLDLH